MKHFETFEEKTKKKSQKGRCLNLVDTRNRKKYLFSRHSLQNLCGEHMQHESLISSGSVSHTVFLFRYHTGLNKKFEQRTSKPNFVIHWQTLLEKILTGLDHNNFLKRCTLNCVPLCQHSIQFSILEKMHFPAPER